MNLRNLRLTLASVNTNPERLDMQVVDTLTSFIRNDDGTLNHDAVENYIFKCLANRGDTINVKLPKHLAAKFTKVKQALDAGETVHVIFDDLKIRAYSMKGGEGKVYSGVSASASDFSYPAPNAHVDLDDVQI